MKSLTVIAFGVLVLSIANAATAATTQKHYYAHDTVEDKNGVIAPWYTGQNGQLDWRVRIAAETMKRYPWSDPAKSARSLPHYLWSGAWKIDKAGNITVPPIGDWMDGDLGQRAAYVLAGLVDYYRYTGDPAAIAHISLQADMLLDFCLTPDDHPWPRFLVSVPTKGKPYYQTNPHGFIQTDIVAEVGIPLIKAAQITGNQRWMDAAKHWGDVFAEKCDHTPGMPPWSRYANPQDVPWEDNLTGGVVFMLEFFDGLIRIGYRGKDDAIVKARQAGIAFLRDVLLPKWTVNEIWGRNYWDWNANYQLENVTEFVGRYLIDHPDEFLNWKNDTRNILTLFLNHTGVSGSNGDVFSGAWAHPESAGCCGRSLWYGPMEIAPVYAQLGTVANDEWAREIGRRQMILATYDGLETGVVEDNIDGGQIVAGAWFKIAHPMALKHCLNQIAWQPELFAPPRENHIVRSTGTISNVIYAAGRVEYSTADAPAHSVDVLRLAFPPKTVTADKNVMNLKKSGDANGYQIEKLEHGDCIVTIRHDELTDIVVEGDDPQHEVDDSALKFDGNWGKAMANRSVQTFDYTKPKGKQRKEVKITSTVRNSSEAGATMTHRFTGNQVQVIGQADSDGGQAEVYIDDEKQLVGIDCWNPEPRYRQTIYYKNGMKQGEHVLKVVVRGIKNPESNGKNVYIDAVQYSDATGTANYGEGGGTGDTQRWIFGYPERTDYIDKAGHAWRPATEWTIRLSNTVDSVDTWYTQRRRLEILGTDEPELYRYGVHGHDFWADFTVKPGTYHVRIKFAETRTIEPKLRAVTIHINGQEMAKNLDITATASEYGKPTTQPQTNRYLTYSGINRAVDLVFNDLQPKNGAISIRFTGDNSAEAIVQAIEVGPGDGGKGAVPMTVHFPTTQKP